jgi:3',5'-cyclic AMP phosphodiesterase CpdA
VLAHLSDLHFGREDRASLEPLRRRLRELAPDVVVVSGDLTQRARSRQFRAARAFLDTLPKPQLVVPGNHDVPLFNLFARFLAPLGGYRRAIAADLEPSYVDDEIALLGINTARSFTWKTGAVSEKQLARVRELARLDRAVKVLVTHHPLAHLVDCGIDVLLAGHLHATSVFFGKALMIQGGTATSSRTRDEPNSFNVLRVARPRIDVEQYVLSGAEFVRHARLSYARENGGWIPIA